MPQSLSRIVIHLVFSTKNRVGYLTDPATREEMNAYIAATLRQHESPAIIVGSAADHAHVLCILSKNVAACKLVEEVKKTSSKWLKSKSPRLAEFQWQAGYGVFSVGEGEVATVRRYIANQEEHHRTATFQDELRRLFREHQVEFDERYVWD